ncbi:hypothetical protein ACIQF6_16080 [Kitasatospora sp. NPDC092948]|uniref:hypothetical protein n=1 Tax=Kitasatospora sp. NPDC092948 TaxID=3364088 RepID=UPI0037FC5138
MDRCTAETRRLLKEILSSWYELAELLPRLEQHLAENTGYVVQIHPTTSILSLSADRIAKYLAEEHPQPAAAIGHLHDWLKSTMGSQRRTDWVGFLARVQRPGLKTDQRADLVAVAAVLCFPPQPLERATNQRLVALADWALTATSVTVLLDEIEKVEPELAQQARAAVKRSRDRVMHIPPPPPRLRRLLAVGTVLLVTAGVVTAVALSGGLPDRTVSWSPSTVPVKGQTDAKVDVPKGAHRLVMHVQLVDPHPELGSCRGLQVLLSTDQGQQTGWQAPDATLSVPVPSDHPELTISLHLDGPADCDQIIKTQSVGFEQ